MSRLAIDVVGSGTDYSKEGEIHRDGGQEDLLRAGLFARRVGPYILWGWPVRGATLA